jgi:hypothetical protein
VAAGRSMPPSRRRSTRRSSTTAKSISRRIGLPG